MSYTLLIVLTLFCSLVQSSVPPPTVAQDYQALVAAEKQFAHFTEQHTIKEGFLQFLSTDAVLYRRKFVNGKDFYAAQQSTATILSWSPQYAAISQSGSFGYTAGPYQIKRHQTAQPSSFGHYISLWAKVDTTWQVIFDLGCPYDEPNDFTAFAYPEQYDKKVATSLDTTRLKSDLMTVERRFSALSAKNSLQAAYQAFLAEQPLLFRTGQQPFDQPAKIKALVVSSQTSVVFTPQDGKVAVAGDLGYVFGYSRTGKLTPKPYLHIWKIDQQREWKLVLEVLTLAAQ
ncbi:MAG: hypothetical protein ACFB0B_00555 [Thermonemataceae bacterium]